MAECSARNSVLLEGTFAIYPKTSVEYHVLVSNSQISYIQCTDHRESRSSSCQKSVEHVVRFSDVVGVDCMRGKCSESAVAYLNVYCYPRQKKTFVSSERLRKRRCLTFVFSHFTSFEENHKDALHWRLVLSYLIHSIPVQLQGKWPWVTLRLWSLVLGHTICQPWVIKC